MTDFSIVILITQSSDAGEYKCVATNDVGISEGVAMLTVRGRGRMCCYNQWGLGVNTKLHTSRSQV